MCTAFVILSFHHTNNINTNIKIIYLYSLLFKTEEVVGAYSNKTNSIFFFYYYSFPPYPHNTRYINTLTWYIIFYSLFSLDVVYHKHVKVSI